MRGTKDKKMALSCDEMKAMKYIVLTSQAKNKPSCLYMMCVYNLSLCDTLLVTTSDSIYTSSRAKTLYCVSTFATQQYVSMGQHSPKHNIPLIICKCHIEPSRVNGHKIQKAAERVLNYVFKR